MKKTFLYKTAFVGLFITTFSSSAQKLYTGFNINYGFGILPLEGEISDYSMMTDVVTYKSTAVSMGKGITTGLYGGYLIKNNIGLELGVNYLYGLSSVIYSDTETGFEYLYEDIYSLKANTVRLVPALRIKFGQKKLSTYIKTGMIFSLGSKAIITENFREMSMGTSEESVYEIEFTGGLSLGFHSGIGLNYSLGKLGIFAEASGYFQNWAPKRGEVVKNEVNGINALSTMTTREKETIFVDDYSYSSATPPSESQPSKELRFYLPMSSVGITVGIQFNFGKTE